jgi:hypothetical protein
MKIEPRVRAAREVLRREARQYDYKAPRFRYEAATHSVADDRNPWQCAHGIDLTLPCPLCERTDEDTRVYQVAKQQRIKQLLNQL